MSAFNTVYFTFMAATEKKVTIGVQFKFGECCQYDYQIGDTIRWGGNDVGNPGIKHVVVDGCLDASCQYVPEDYEVHIKNDRIDQVVPSSGKYDFVKSTDTYIILED